MSPIRHLIIAFASCTLFAPTTTAAPIPGNVSPLPGKRPPTPEELDAAIKAYQAVGGWHYRESGAGLTPRIFHRFHLSPLTAEAAAKVPDLPFEYRLEVGLQPGVTTPAAIRQLGRLKNLRWVELSGSSGDWKDPLRDVGNVTPLVAELAAVPNLEHLGLETHLGAIPLTDDMAEKFVGLKSLKLLVGKGPITDAGLAKLAQHPTLEHLSLLACDRITDAGLVHLARMKNLRGLVIQGCSKPTAAGIRHFTVEPRLTGLAIGGAGMTEDALTEVGKIWTLEWLDIGGLEGLEGVVTTRGLRHVAQLPRLRELGLPWMKLSDETLESLSGAAGVEKLRLFNCPAVTDAGLKHLTRMACLKTLWLHSPENVTDAGLKELAKLPRLELLLLDKAKQVTDAGVKNLLLSKSLTGFEVNGSRVTEAAVREFVNDRGRRLTWLGVNGIPVNDEFVAYVSFTAPHLTRFNLQDCKGVTDKSVSHLAGLDKLHWLTLHGTSISPDGIRTLLKRLPYARIEAPPPPSEARGR